MSTILILRRVTGSIMLLALLVYLVATFMNYDAPNFDLPNWATSRVVQIGYLILMIWCFLPQLTPMRSPQQVNLTPTGQPFMQALNEANTEMPPQGQWSEPVNQQGQWVAQGPDGGWYVHKNGDWHRYS